MTEATAGSLKHKKAPLSVPLITEKAKVYANLLAVPVALVVVWQAVSSSGLILELILPRPTKVIAAFLRIANDGSLGKDLAISAWRVLRGYLWGVGLGVAIGIGCGLFKFLERLVGPLVDAMRQIPMMAWIPLIIMWWGIGEASKTIIIAKSVFMPVFMNTFQGIRGVSKDYFEVAWALELGYFKMLRKIVFPAALPSIFTGIRFGAGVAWMGVTAAEMLGGITGMGYALMRARDYLESDILIANMAVIGVVGLILDRVLRLAERRVLHWRKAVNG
jgi:sulfonate transport system permease protein